MQYKFDEYIVEHPQYWQGVTLAFSGYDDVFTGIGPTPRDAARDAMDQLAQSERQVPVTMWAALEADLISYSEDESACTDCAFGSGVEGCGDEDCELAFYINLWVRGE